MSECSTRDLGSFEVTSGSIIVSDPCYEKDVWCCNSIEQVKCGTWTAEVDIHDEGEWGWRIAVLRIQAAIPPKVLPSPESAPFAVAVDSGQAGFFDAMHYRDSEMLRKKTGSKSTDPDLWYWHCCQITLSPQQAGVLPYGVVSSSGFGDGAYECLIYRNACGEAIRVEIIFIEDASENEEDWLEDEED